MNTTLPASVLAEHKIWFDWTRFRGLLACQRRAWYENVAARVPAEDTTALNFGRALHEALDVRQKLLMAGETKGLVGAMEEALERAFIGEQTCPARCNGAKSCLTCGGAGVVFRPIVVPEDDHRTLGRAKEVAGLYAQEHPTEDFEILASELAREKLLGSVRVAGMAEPVQVFWRGKTDGIWRRRDTGRLAVKDTKTMREGKSERLARKYRRSGQLMMYCWLFGDLYPGLSEGVVDAVIVRPPVVRASKLPRTELHRVVVSFMPEEIEECKRDALVTIGQWLDACAQGLPPLNRESCDFCGFWEVCDLANEQDRLEWLAGGRFRANTFDPLAEATAEAKITK